MFLKKDLVSELLASQQILGEMFVGDPTKAKTQFLLNGSVRKIKRLRIYSCQNFKYSISAISRSTQELDDIKKELKKLILKKQVFSKSQVKNENFLCWYHSKFGTAAKKLITSCE